MLALFPPFDNLVQLVHSVRRLNDDVPGAARVFGRVVGAGPSLYLPELQTTISDTGYSGNPLALLPFRPDQSPETWMYVADSLKNVKVRVDGTVYGRGIAPPLAAPGAVFAQPLFRLVDDFGALYTAGGTASAPAVATRVNTTIGNSILFDVGTTGWASIQPAATPIWAGMTLVINTGGGTQETVVVVSVAPPVPVGITVGAISYDTGNSGPCTVQPSPSTTPTYGLDRDALVQLGTNGEMVRVLSVSRGPDGSFSFRRRWHLP